MEMGWISFVGSQVSNRWIALGIFFILSFHSISQENVYSIPRQTAIDHQRFYTTSDDTLLVVFYHNRLGEISELDLVSILNKKSMHWVVPSGANWIDLNIIDNSIFLYYSELNNAKDRLSIEEVCILDMQEYKTREVLNYPHLKDGNTPRFSLRSNSGFLVFLSRFMSFKSKELLAFQCASEEGQWQLKNAAAWQIAKQWTDWELSRWDIDSNGDIVLFPGENRGFEIQEKNVLPGKWELYYYQFDAKHLKEWELLIGDKQLREAYWVHLNDSTLVLGILCSSMYQEEIKGWLRYTVDTRRAEVVNQSYQPLLYAKESGRKWQGHGVLKGDNGSFALVGEHYYSTEIRTTDFQTGRTYSNWVQHFDEIYFQMLNPDLSVLDSVALIHKSQEMENGEGCSFRVFETSGKWYLEYNDLENNDPRQASNRSWTGRKGEVKRVGIIDQRITSVAGLNKEDAMIKKGMWMPVNIKGGEFSVWWTINDIVICRDKK